MWSSEVAIWEMHVPKYSILKVSLAFMSYLVPGIWCTEVTITSSTAQFPLYLAYCIGWCIGWCISLCHTPLGRFWMVDICTVWIVWIGSVPNISALETSREEYVEVWELKLYFYPSAGGLKKKKKKKSLAKRLPKTYCPVLVPSWLSTPIAVELPKPPQGCGGVIHPCMHVYGR